jgi:hypothetical protein
MKNDTIIKNEKYKLTMWRARLHPWTQPVPAGCCTAPRGVHPATCTTWCTPCYHKNIKMMTKMIEAPKKFDKIIVYVIIPFCIILSAIYV